jgi:hypothetical protein
VELAVHAVLAPLHRPVGVKLFPDFRRGRGVEKDEKGFFLKCIFFFSSYVL